MLGSRPGPLHLSGEQGMKGGGQTPMPEREVRVLEKKLLSGD